MENKVMRFVFTSSTTYYGVERGIPFPKPIIESNPIVTQFAKAGDLNCRECDIAYSTSKVISEQILANYGLNKKMEVIILRIGPVRARGVNDPFLGTQLKMENCMQALELAITTQKNIWYEAMTVMDELKDVDIEKAKKILGYKPI